jgi:predicted nucleic acid-binding protein
MASEIFVDTGGFYALLSPHDHWHEKAIAAMKRLPASHLLVSTDYVLAETATLLRARGQSHLVDPWFAEVFKSARFKIVWMEPARFEEVRQFFVKHGDKAWSFTDCFSFCVMQQRKTRRALAADQHFRQAGFEPLLIKESNVD